MLPNPHLAKGDRAAGEGQKQSVGDVEGEGMEEMERARSELSSVPPGLRLPPASLEETLAKARGADMG